MFLKRLDIVGFKSFAEKMSIDFVPGVTAVVGPNGSGKSNITEAIRWVMGEQSAKSLRGSKMEDIIFAGSDTRRALNLAEVTLTLDNEDQFLPLDYNEISITRRVYRSGDSEFLINNQSCRLKDIVDLFMDSGLGREAFSIIGQGKVEEILSSKAEERRKIFEEAAGVLKYKTRKRKAELRLMETQENLNRVMDILYEIEGQLEPLKIQASVARDYLEKKEELEKVDVAVTAFEIEELHERWEKLKALIAEHKGLEEKLTENIQSHEAKITGIQAQVEELDRGIEQLHQSLLTTSEELEKLEGKKEVLKERKKNAKQNQQQMERLVLEYQHKLEELCLARDQEVGHLVTYREEVARMKEELKKKQELFAIYNENLEEKLEELKSEYFEVVNNQTTFKNERTFLENQLVQNSDKQRRLDETNERYVREREELGVRKEAEDEKLQAFSNDLEKKLCALKDTQASLEKLREDYRKKESTLYQAYQYVQQTKSRKDMLEEMQEDYAGYFQGVKEVLKARDQELSGIEGAVAELIVVPKEYETAIEIALGSATQHVVMKDEQSARAAIGFLKRNGHGRATFLPMTAIKGKEVSSYHEQTLRNHSAFVGIAAELLQYDRKYHHILTNLLGTIVIVKDLKSANELAKSVQHRYRFVTLDGDVVNPGGSMTGGAVKQKTNSLLSRQRELETITAKLADMEEKTTILEEQVKKLKQAIERGEVKVADERTEAEALKEQEQELRATIHKLSLEEKALNDRLSIYDQDIASFEQDKETMHQRISELNQSLADHKEQLMLLDEQIADVTARKNEQKSSKETVQSELTEIKVQLAGKEQILTNQEEKQERLTFEIDQTTKRLQEVKEDLSLLTTEMTSNDSGELTLEDAAKQKLEEKNEVASLLQKQQDHRLASQRQLDEAEGVLREIERQYKQVANSLKDEEVQVNRMEVELDNRLHQLREEYGLSFEAAKEKYPLRMDILEARKKIKLIKMALSDLGPVNVGAIEEYDRIHERYTFLNEQREDLDEAKQTLYQIIEEMDEEMKKRFSQTFQSIRAEFDAVFTSLFGGGRADLRLTNPDDLLKTGVDIVAQPPGKKLQNLGLLSGGERSLTAIALLFSILKVRPVPFCVLDEVEAALDEANVQRFATYLQTFSDETQFIVITHRKGTMEEADVLYGVTMQESGVSKLVSVKLEETKQLV